MEELNHPRPQKERGTLVPPADTISLVPFVKIIEIAGQCDTSGGVCVFTFTVPNLRHLATHLDDAAAGVIKVDFLVGSYTWCVRYGLEIGDWSLDGRTITLHTNRVDVAALADDLRGVAEAFQSAPDNT